MRSSAGRLVGGVIWILVTLTAAGPVEARGLSALRPPNVSGEAIRSFQENLWQTEQIRKSFNIIPFTQPPPAQPQQNGDEGTPPNPSGPGPGPDPGSGTVRSALSAATSIDQVTHWERVPSTTKAELAASFDLSFRMRPLKDEKERARRATWLYPDDGCYARAELVVDRLEAEQKTVPAKIFAFGSLRVSTPNSPQGTATWWYHVAPILKVAADYYVLDAAINPKAPMLLSAWIQALGNPSDLSLALCPTHVYDPNSNCDTPVGSQEAQAISDEAQFLPLEWDRLVELNRDPQAELLEAPQPPAPARRPTPHPAATTAGPH